MDFIETLFGMSPDGGDGSTEAIWLVAIAAVGVLAFRRRMVAWVLARRTPK